MSTWVDAPDRNGWWWARTEGHREIVQVMLTGEGFKVFRDGLKTLAAYTKIMGGPPKWQRVAEPDGPLLEDKIESALDKAHQYGQIEGDHHRAWVIDQMVRALLGEDYDDWVRNYEYDEATEEQCDANEPAYTWDVGIAP